MQPLVGPRTWLLGQVSQGAVLWDGVCFELLGIARGRTEIADRFELPSKENVLLETHAAESPGIAPAMLLFRAHSGGT